MKLYVITQSEQNDQIEVEVYSSYSEAYDTYKDLAGNMLAPYFFNPLEVIRSGYGLWKHASSLIEAVYTNKKFQLRCDGEKIITLALHECEV